MALRRLRRMASISTSWSADRRRMSWTRTKPHSKARAGQLSSSMRVAAEEAGARPTPAPTVALTVYSSAAALATRRTSIHARGRQSRRTPTAATAAGYRPLVHAPGVEHADARHALLVGGFQVPPHIEPPVVPPRSISQDLPHPPHVGLP